MLDYRQVLERWQDDSDFADFFCSILRECGFDAYVWETPVLSGSKLDQDFEFVIVNTRRYWSRPDTSTFAEYFDRHAEPHGIVSFLNLGGDAMLVVPSPLQEAANYSGLAEFFATAPAAQQRALWQVLSRQAKARMANGDTWISVAGGGVAWLHLRLDDRPKYYRYLPYTRGR